MAKMCDPRTACLVDCSKKGLALRFDPSGSFNRCYYRCLAQFLNIAEEDLIDTIQGFMITKQFLSIKDEVRIFLSKHIIYLV
jgi:hypothetical protein